jgi:hypothetical protein
MKRCLEALEGPARSQGQEAGGGAAAGCVWMTRTCGAILARRVESNRGKSVLAPL